MESLGVFGQKPSGIVCEKVDEIFTELNEQKRTPPGGDGVISAMSHALLQESMTNEQVYTTIQDVVSLRRPHSSISEILGVIRTVLVIDQWEHGRQPQYWDHWTQWVQPIQEFVSLVNNTDIRGPQTERQDRYIGYLIDKKVTTNPFTRAVPEEIIMQALAPYYPHGYVGLDIGAGMQETDKQIFLKKEHPFEKVRLYQSIGNTAVCHASAEPHEEETTGRLNLQLSQKAQLLLARSPLLKDLEAVDLIDPSSQDEQRWSEASLRFTEQRDEKFMAKYRALQAAAPPHLRFTKLDVTDGPSLKRYRQQHQNRKPNIITISTMLHQLGLVAAMQLVEDIKPFLAEDGIMVIKDFVEVRPEDPHTLHFFNNWHEEPGRYRTYVYSAAKPANGLQEVFRAAKRDSRCLELVIGEGVITAGGAEHTIDELIEAA